VLQRKAWIQPKQTINLWPNYKYPLPEQTILQNENALIAFPEAIIFIFREYPNFHTMVPLNKDYEGSNGSTTNNTGPEKF